MPAWTGIVLVGHFADDSTELVGAVVLTVGTWSVSPVVLVAERRVPVVVLAGFLATGKTTVINHLLRTSAGVRIGLVVNDFGARTSTRCSS